MSVEREATRAADSSPRGGGTSLVGRLILRLVMMPVGLAAVLFLPAGTWKWRQAWVYLLVMILPLEATFLRLAIHDPRLLARRMQSREEVSEQRWLIRLLRPFFLIGFVLPGFDFRFGWSRALVGELPAWLSVLADLTILSGILCIAWVLEVNSYAGRTIRVESAQTVISTGPYGIVRHPLYTGSIALWTFTPLALGSWIGFPFAALLIPFYVFRLLNEEKVLRAQLSGYPGYCNQTRWRLFPFVW